MFSANRANELFYIDIPKKNSVLSLKGSYPEIKIDVFHKKDFDYW